MLHASCFMLHATWYMLHATCYMLQATCTIHAIHMLHAIHAIHAIHATCYMYNLSLVPRCNTPKHLPSTKKNRCNGLS